MSGDLDVLVRSLGRRDCLSAAERKALHSLLYRKKVYQRGESILHAGMRPNEVHLLTSGMAIRYGTVTGKRQITSFQIPGSLLDLHTMLLKEVDQDVDAQTDCVAVLIPHAAIKHLLAREPHLSRLLYLLVVVDEATEREWIKGLRRRSSLANLAHLLCEMYVRLRSMDLATDHRFAFPVTQEDVADALGISTVHANRTIQDLRRTGLVDWPDHVVHIVDNGGLAQLGEFDPGYLSLSREPR
jgi:CRP-like cAMP-binding protein